MADEVLVTEFRLNDKMSAKMATLRGSVGAFVRQLGAGGASSGAIGAVSGVGLAFGAAAVGVAAFANKASQAAGDFEALVRGLEAYAGSAENLQYQLAVLKEVAKAPGLGFEEAIRGAVRLQAAGVGFETAADAIKGFGNALALVGGGKAELDGVLLALTQIAAKGKVSAEEILQIQERVPQIRGVIQSQFGTSDTERLQKMGVTAQQFIQAITKGLAALPQAPDSIKNQREVMQDELNQAFVAVGNEVNQFLLPIMKAFTQELSVLSQSGVVKEFTGGILQLAGIFGAQDVKTVFRTFVAELSTMPMRLENFGRSIAATIDFIAGTISGNRDRATSGLGELMGLSGGMEGFERLLQMRRDLTLKRLDQAEKDFIKSESAGVERRGADAITPAIDPAKLTATNTAKLVDLQKQQLDISRQILGGGTIAGESASAVRIDRALGSSGSRGSRMLADAISEMIREYAGGLVASQRNSGASRTYQVR